MVRFLIRPDPLLELAGAGELPRPRRVREALRRGDPQLGQSAQGLERLVVELVARARPAAAASAAATAPMPRNTRRDDDQHARSPPAPAARCRRAAARGSSRRPCSPARPPGRCRTARRRMVLMPIAALASSPVERSAKNFVGSRSSRSHTAGCSALSMRPSMRRMVMFCSSMNAAETMLREHDRQRDLDDEARLGVRHVHAEHLSGGDGHQRAEADRHQPAERQIAHVRAGAAQAEAQQLPGVHGPFGQRAVEHHGARLEFVRVVPRRCRVAQAGGRVHRLVPAAPPQQRDRRAGLGPVAHQRTGVLPPPAARRA